MYVKKTQYLNEGKFSCLIYKEFSFLIRFLFLVSKITFSFSALNVYSNCYIFCFLIPTSVPMVQFQMFSLIMNHFFLLLCISKDI